MNIENKRRWIISLCLVLALCVTGQFLKSRSDVTEALSEYEPLSFDNVEEIYAEAEKASENRGEAEYKVNINTAGVEQLCELENIGEKTAKSIVEFRNKSGAFKNIQEIMLVEGIGEKTFSQISKNLTVE